MRGQQSRFLSPARGFTLIELLTVVAIIAILAGIAGVGLPRALEKARLTDMDSDFANIRTALVTYYADHGSYPPGYGFPVREWLNQQLADHNEVPNPTELLKSGDTPKSAYYTNPYMSYLGLYGSTGVYDRFSTNYDTDADGIVGRMEYQPIAETDDTDKTPKFPDEFPYGDGGLESVTDLGGEYLAQRPYVYVPINKEQFKIAEKYWDGKYPDTPPDIDAKTWPSNWLTPSSPLYSLRKPAPRYDAYVLISVGPSGNTTGVLNPTDEQDFVSNIGNATYYYPFLALRTYYLATRDANDNKVLDFDFRARTQQKESEAFPEMPNGDRGHAPIIYIPDK